METKDQHQQNELKSKKHKINGPTIIGIVLVILVLALAMLWMLRVDRPKRPAVEVGVVISNEPYSSLQESDSSPSSDLSSEVSESSESSEPVASYAASERPKSTHRPEPASSRPPEKPTVAESMPPESSSQVSEEPDLPGSDPSEDLSSSPEESPKININTATKEDLLTLKGINISLAKKIIAYRESEGPFEKIEDLMNVYGIDERIFNRIKDDICV
ncbi:ComEA family DNA-binding protein [Solibaculum mannosilyticum]|uniref:ComEA family DNA-binding protein n=1 Tax=Solibaculum mannosilyticum TaxID=2780922 RepID=UPI000B7EF69C|nr:helix-hairpin-helix domain-containing protein [Solibaculum mannosilyticum]